MLYIFRLIVTVIYSILGLYFRFYLLPFQPT
ncbi:Uncharacterised protein [Salmonella enterica subsp. arizonae]|uniref:Uncharacterized protein n=1 Tax=Salmonella enterica subsp. arizonae TaxID=59203 RepID=A0A379RZJ6_SALER|nr:Uncharacterised protein [Salmonella enterica subsp. arizonae]